MRLLAAPCLVAALAACGDSPSSPTSATTPAVSNPEPPPPDQPTYATVTVVGAGDIGWCGSPAPESTAAIVDGIAGTVITMGDQGYPGGHPENFRDCYDPSWGRHKWRTRPSPGNHDYADGVDPAAYFAYFGDNAGPAGLGYYSYDLEAWHIVSLDSEQSSSQGSAQWSWLKQDLEASTKPCTLAYWHRPLFSSGPHGSQSRMRDAWRLLYAAGAEIVLNGHDHLYERFAPQTPDGAADPERGIRQFTVGTGGAMPFNFQTVLPNSEFQVREFGVIQLTLMPAGYSWQFLPAMNGTISDSGTGTCH